MPPNGKEPKTMPIIKCSWRSGGSGSIFKQVNQSKKFIFRKPTPCNQRQYGGGCWDVTASVLHYTRHLLLNNTSMIVDFNCMNTFFFISFWDIWLKIGFHRLPTHRPCAHSIFFGWSLNFNLESKFWRCVSFMIKKQLGVIETYYFSFSLTLYFVNYYYLSFWDIT